MNKLIEEQNQNECDCCGWDDNGYQHEPQCSALKDQISHLENIKKGFV
jgi:hypothetical protein